MVKSLSILSDVNGVVTVRRMVQNADEQEVGAEGTSQHEVFLGVGSFDKCEG